MLIANDAKNGSLVYPSAPAEMRIGRETVHQLLILGFNPGINELVGDILKHHGFTSKVTDPHRLLSLHEVAGYQALIIDDEEGLASELQQRYPRLPIIFLSTSARPCGENCLVVPKPFSVDVLMEAVKASLGLF